MTTYRDSGVDIDAGNRTIELIKPLAAATQGPQVLAGVGPFSGLFALDTNRYREPVLVASTDGVGTKVLLASGAGRHAQIGADLVNHCVNDVLTAGAEPLFFLDYFATGKLEPEILAELVEGAAEACRGAGCALVGGETAEMPGVYALGDYDIAGFIVGIVEKARIIEPNRIEAGDALVGLPSSGLHTNGFSLVRYLFREESYQDVVPELGRTLADELLEPHRSYLAHLRLARGAVDLLGVAHITGGGLIENVPRCLPDELGAEIVTAAWTVPQIFQLIQSKGVLADEMWRTFNMGIGMVLVVHQADLAELLRALDGTGAMAIGKVVSPDGPERVRLA